MEMYEKPRMEIIELGNDVIVTSGCTGGGVDSINSCGSNTCASDCDADFGFGGGGSGGAR